MIKRNIISIAIISLLILSLVGCMAMHHKIGKGALGNDVQTQHQWYILYGLVPINDIDTQAMAGGATNYEITTEITFVDGIINCFTNCVSVSCVSVTVKK